jgi:hypothetical protein
MIRALISLASARGQPREKVCDPIKTHLHMC